MAHHDRLTLDRREQVPGPARQMEVGAQPPGPGHQDGRRTPDRPGPAWRAAWPPDRKGASARSFPRESRVDRKRACRPPPRCGPWGGESPAQATRSVPTWGAAPAAHEPVCNRIFRQLLAGARMLHIFGRNSDPRADNEGKSDRRRRPVCHRCDRCGVEWTAGRGLERPALRPGGADARQLGIARRPIGNGPPGRTDGTDRRTDGRWRRRAPRVGSPTERRHTERARRPDPGCPPGERKVVA